MAPLAAPVNRMYHYIFRNTVGVIFAGVLVTGGAALQSFR